MSGVFARERTWCCGSGALFSRPSAYLSLGFLTLGGFVCGVLFWGAFNTALELTNTETFCISCHEMHDNVYQELAADGSFLQSVRRAREHVRIATFRMSGRLRSRVRCKRPRKYGARFSAPSTPARNFSTCIELAKHEWVRMKAEQLLECRNCHSSIAMDFTSKRGVPPKSIRAFSSTESAPASIAIRASLTNCQT